MGMGIALAGLSGAGQAVGEELQSQDRFDQEQQLMQQKSDLDMQKAMQLAHYNANLADAQRGQAVARVTAAAQPYLDNYTLDNAMADPAFAAGIGGRPDVGTLSDAQRAKYAPTMQQRTDATLQGARDTQDLSFPALLQSSLADKAQQHAAAMQDKLIAANDAIARDSHAFNRQTTNDAVSAAFAAGQHAAAQRWQPLINAGNGAGGNSQALYVGRDGLPHPAPVADQGDALATRMAMPPD